MSKLPFLSDAHHFAIASVAVRAAQLDNHLEMTCAILMRKQKDTARFLLKHLGGDKPVDLAKCLIMDLVPSHKSEVEAIFGRVKELRTERNELLHWIYGKTEDETVVRYFQTRPFRERKMKSATAGQISAIADEFLLLVRLMTSWTFYAGDLLEPALSGIPPPSWASVKKNNQLITQWLTVHLKRTSPKK